MKDQRRYFDGNTINKNVKNEKNVIKNSLQKKRFIPPSLQDVKNYFKEKGYQEEIGKKAWAYYDSSGWKDSRGIQVKNWKQKMIGNWFKDKNKIKSYNNFRKQVYEE